ncbi:MAG: GMC oxidoreductase [Pleurocapsa sp.]
MIIDARKLASGTIISGDICIVGGGAAGITLAKELSDRFDNIILVESGGMNLERETQDLYRGEILDPNHGSLEGQRQRQLGGTTNVRVGRCAPFDDLDFESRSYVPHSGWAISKQDLEPYYKEAHKYCELGPYAYDVQSALGEAAPAMIPGLDSEAILTDKLWLFSPPTNFKTKYQKFLNQSRQIQTYLHANCLKLITNMEGTTIDSLQCASLKQNNFTVRASVYILAAGCLEVTRLLWLSNDSHKKGFGYHHDLLGRFYMGHISGDVGKVTFNRGRVIWDYETTKDGVYARRAIYLSPVIQQQHRLMNLRAILHYPEMSDPNHGNSILSAMYLAKSLLLLRQTSRIYYSKDLDTSRLKDTFGSHLQNILGGFNTLSGFAYKWIFQRLLSKRQIPSVVLGSKSNTYTLHFDAEQSPNYNSRVMLGEERDCFGLNRLKVDWRYTDRDIQNVIDSYHLIAQNLAETGVGKLEFFPEQMSDLIKQNLGVGSHHIGTTRMSNSPTEGVVDRECKVHGINNLYVASSSVFPTSSYVNPTLTIIAIDLRLADR